MPLRLRCVLGEKMTESGFIADDQKPPPGDMKTGSFSMAKTILRHSFSDPYWEIMKHLPSFQETAAQTVEIQIRVIHHKSENFDLYIIGLSNLGMLY